MSLKIQLILAALLALGAFLHHQNREKNLVLKKDQLTTLEHKLANHETRSPDRKRAARRDSSTSISDQIAQLRKLANNPLDPETLIKLLEGKHDYVNHDIQAWHELFLTLCARNQTELAKLLEDLRNSDVSDDLLQRFEGDISQLYPSKKDFETQIRETLSGDIKMFSHNQLFAQWLSAEPDLARKWLDQELESPTLTGKGLDNDPIESMTSILTMNLFMKSSPDAIKYYDQLSETEQSRVRWQVASKVSQEGPERLESFLKEPSNPEIRERVIYALVRTQAEKNQSRDEILSSSQTLGLSDKERVSVLQNIASNPHLFKDDSFQTRLDWVQQNSESIHPYLMSLTEGSYHQHRGEIESWAAQQTDLVAKDKVYERLNSLAIHRQESPQRAANYLIQISNPKTQQRVYQEQTRWLPEALKTQFDQQLISAGLDLEALRQD